MSHPSWNGRALTAALFDLDGTLVDTLADIAMALNRSLAEFDVAAFADEEVRRMIGRGSPILIQRAVTARGGATEATQAAMLERFFHYYGELEESTESTARAYEGAAAVLGKLHDAGLHIAVVTNKHFRFASALLERLHLAPAVDLIVGGDTCERRKPDPQPLLFACRSLQAAPHEALMVGDSANDVQAARAAHVPIICVTYGYNQGEAAGSLSGDLLIDSLTQLPKLLQVSDA